MAINLVHATQATSEDAGNGDIRKAQWNAGHTLTIGANFLLGRLSTAGAVQEIAFTSYIATLLDDSSATAAKNTLQIYDLGPNIQSGTSYTLLNTEAVRTQALLMTSGSANTVTIPTNATQAFPIGTCISVVQDGAGVTTISAASGVTLNGVSAGSGAINNRYQGVSLLKTGTNTWVASGDIATVT